MDLGEFTLAELLAEVAARIEHTNGLEFVAASLASSVASSITAALSSGEVGYCVDRFL